MTGKLNILIIEDEIVLQNVYKLVLSTHGHTVVTANNGVEGLAQIKKIAPDVVLLDIFMPVMDGKEFLRNIDVNEYPNTKIVVYSNLSDNDTEEEMRQLGAHDFVLKSSMAPQDLISLINKTVGR